MEETVEELVTKHTRRELEEMAVKLGIQSLGGTKAQLAESIIEARRRAQPQIAESGTAEVQVKPEEQKGVPEKAAEVKSQVSPEVLPVVPGKGVRARQEAMRRKSVELRSAGAAIRDEGVSRMAKSVNALKKSIEGQVTENKKGIAKIRTGVRQMKLSIGKTSEELRKAGERIREEGARELNEGLRAFRADLDNQIRENRDAVSRMNTAARELHSRALALRDDMQRYVDQDVNKYIRDFYYG